MLKKILAVVACVCTLTAVFASCNSQGTQPIKNPGNGSGITYVEEANYTKELTNCQKLVDDNKSEPARLAVAYAHAWNYAIDNKGDGCNAWLKKIRDGEITDSEIPSSLSADKDTLLNYNKKIVALTAKRDEMAAKYTALSQPSDDNKTKFKTFEKQFKKFDSLYELAGKPSGSYNDYIKDVESGLKGFVEDITL